MPSKCSQPTPADTTPRHSSQHSEDEAVPDSSLPAVVQAWPGLGWSLPPWSHPLESPRDDLCGVNRSVGFLRVLSRAAKSQHPQVARGAHPSTPCPGGEPSVLPGMGQLGAVGVQAHLAWEERCPPSAVTDYNLGGLNSSRVFS